MRYIKGIMEKRWKYMVNPQIVIFVDRLGVYGDELRR
jgi:hypothetical protein